MGNEESRTIKTAERLFDIIEGLDELGQAGVTELGNHVDIPKSSLYQYLSTFERRGYVVKKNGTYRLSLRLLGQGTKIRENMALYEHGRSYLDDLAERTGENVWLTAEEHGYCVTLDRAVGEHGFEKFSGTIGGRSELHTHAAGKAILAHFPEERVDDIVDRHGLAAQTDETIRERETLFEELSTIRDRGYALNDNESIEGVRAVGVVIMANEEVLGSIAVGGPQNRLQGDYYRDELPTLLQGVANEIELQTSVTSPW